jgi:hypothetical protein
VRCKVAEYTAEAAKAGGLGDESLGMLFHKLSQAPVVTIAKLRGRRRRSARGTGVCYSVTAVREWAEQPAINTAPDLQSRPVSPVVR